MRTATSSRPSAPFLAVLALAFVAAIGAARAQDADPGAGGDAVPEASQDEAPDPVADEAADEPGDEVVAPPPAPPVSLEGVQRLAERWLGERAGEVAFELSTGSLSEEGHDAWAVLVIEGGTRIYGESQIALARGLFEYLRADAKRLPSWWSGRATNGAGAAPVAEPKRGASPHALRLYLEPEAFAYAAAFWDANRWEREIDLAALRGFTAVTMPLGTDRVWTEVYKRLEIDPTLYGSWSTGPAFRAFGWTGDAVGWMGPQSLTFADADVAIARRALSRMRELGVEPVLPAFTGVLPKRFAEAFPDATYFELGSWAGLGDAVLLDPADPLFTRVAELFYDVQARLIGRSALYFGTPLGEGRAIEVEDGAVLERVAAGVGDALATWRSGARLVVSSWPMVFDRGFWKDARIERFLGGFANEQVIVLDRRAATQPLWSATDGFFGHAWLWGVTPTLGGRQQLGGPTVDASARLAEALASEHAPGGAAIAHEAPGTDPLHFEFLCDQLWSAAPLEPDAWVERWVAARYGSADPRAVRAWRRVLAAAYGPGAQRPGPSAVVAAPSTLAPPAPEGAAELALAWRELVAYAEDASGGDPGALRPALAFDLVDLGRQVLGDAAVAPITAALEAFAAGDAERFESASARALELMADLDELLATHTGFLLGAWLESAGARGGDDVERAAIMAGARALVTHFGPIGSPLRDWGGRAWAGLVSAFHRERWRRLFESLSASLSTGAAFDGAAFDAELAAFEREWAARTNPFSAVPMGAPLEVARALADTWVPRVTAPDTVPLPPTAALVDETSAPLARWRVGEGAAVGGTRLSSELEFAGFLRETFGVGFDLLEWRASGWDAPDARGTRDALVSALGGAPADVRALAQRAGLRLALVGGAAVGADDEAQRLRRRDLERLVGDLELGGLVFDAALAPATGDGGAALARLVAALRQRADDLLVLARGVDPGEARPLFASTGVADGPWFAASSGARLFAHGQDLARGRGDTRTAENPPVLLDGRARWADALVWQAFGLAGVFGFDVSGAPWLLDDRDLVRFARLLEVFEEHRHLLGAPVTLASNGYADGAVARGTERAQLVVVRNLSFEPVTVELPVGQELGLAADTEFEARQLHPDERALGRVASGDALRVTVAPFGCALVVLSADGFERPIVEGCDQLWVPAPDGGAARVVLFAEPGAEVRVRLSGDASSFERASVDGVGVDALLDGRELRLRFDGAPDGTTGTVALGALEGVALPANAGELLGAARASIVSQSTLALVQSRAPSGFPAVERARRLALADLERLDAGAATATVLESDPSAARRLRVRLPETLGAGRTLAVTTVWRDGAPAGRTAVVARIPERGLVGARERFGAPGATTHVIELRPQDAGREIDVWVLSDGEEGAAIESARAWLRPGPDTRATRTLVLE